MVNRSVGALLAIAFVLIVCVGSLFAQERPKIGRFSDFYGDAKVKEVGATGTFVQLQDTWLNMGVYKGDELVTGQDSYVKVMIETTKVELHEKSRASIDMTDEGLYLVNLVKGSITAHIETDVFQLKVLNQTIYGKGAVVNVKIRPNRDIIIKAESGAPYIDNEYGATLVVPQEQVVTIKYDRLKRQYVFQPSAENTINLGVLPKGKKDPVEITNWEEFVINEDGEGNVREFKAGPKRPEPRTPWPKRKFSINALVRYDWFDSDRDIYWYRGEKETFKTTRASLGIATTYKFAEIFLGIDAAKDNPLEDLYLRLFIPKKEKLFNVKIGQMQVPFGSQVRMRPENLLLLEYSQAVKYAFASVQGDPDSSDLDYLYDSGIQLCGELELFAGVRFEYGAGIFNGEKRVTSETNDGKAVIGRIGLNFSDSFTVGVSTYEGEIWITPGDRYSTMSRRRNGIDFKIQADQFILQGEYIWAEDNPATLSSLPATYGHGTKYNITEGYCLEMGLGLSVLKESWKKWMLVAKLDVLDPPKGLVNAGAEHQHLKSTIFAAGLVWQLSDEVKFSAVFETLSQGNDRYTAPLKEGDANQRAILQFNISF